MYYDQQFLTEIPSLVELTLGTETDLRDSGSFTIILSAVVRAARITNSAKKGIVFTRSDD